MVSFQHGRLLGLNNVLCTEVTENASWWRASRHAQYDFSACREETLQKVAFCEVGALATSKKPTNEVGMVAGYVRDFVLLSRHSLGDYISARGSASVHY